MRGSVLIVCCACVVFADAWWLDLDLSIDSALEGSNHFDSTRNGGSYLRDSFRTEVLNPSLDRIIKAIRQIRRSDERVEGTLSALLGITILCLGYLAFSVKYEKRILP